MQRVEVYHSSRLSSPAASASPGVRASGRLSDPRQCRAVGGGHLCLRLILAPGSDLRVTSGGHGHAGRVYRGCDQAPMATNGRQWPSMAANGVQRAPGRWRLGLTKNPTYKSVCWGDGHTEAIKVCPCLPGGSERETA